MKKKHFILSLIEILFVIFAIFFIYNKIMYIVNVSRVETENVCSKFKIRDKKFYENKWRRIRKNDFRRI